MPNRRNVEAVTELEQEFARAENVFVTDYRGLKVADLANLRGRLREAGVEYKVAKNTLTKIAAEQAGLPGLAAFLTGPSALAFVTGDEIVAAKALTDFARISRILTVKGGVIQRVVLTSADVEALAALPGQSQLRADLVGAVQGPMASVIGALNGALSGVVHALEERTKQLQPA